MALPKKLSLMRIGFDVSQTGPAKAGCGFFAEGLIRELTAYDKRNEYLLYPTFGDSFWDPMWRSTIRIDRPNVKTLVATKTHEATRQLWSSPPSDLDALLGQPEIIHSNNYFCPPKSSARLVYTLYDLSFIEHPDCTTEANRIVCFNGVFEASLRADLLVAISESTREHFLATFPHVSAETVQVVHPSGRFDAATQQPKPAGLDSLQSGFFWLCVGTLEPRKNHARLLDAYSRLVDEKLTEIPLVLVGSRGWMAQELDARLRQLEREKDVRSLGYVDDATLLWLYQNCFAFVYPSLFEGFGLPVLEAMSAGAPVISSNTSSLPELTGDAALLVEPTDSIQLYEAMRQLSEDDGFRLSLGRRARERAAVFSWASSAQRLIELYESLGEAS